MKTVFGLGVILIGVGIASYVITGMTSWTALIPSILGVIIAILAQASASSPHKKSFLYGIIAVTLLGMGGSIGGIKEVYLFISGTSSELSGANIARSITALLLAATSAFSFAEIKRKSDSNE